MRAFPICLVALAAPVMLAPTFVQASVCVGDCDANRSVTVDEVLVMVNITLGNAELSTCPAGDVNGDSRITIDEILRAVNAALNGCPAAPSPTATATATRVLPTATAPPTSTPRGSGVMFGNTYYPFRTGESWTYGFTNAGYTCTSTETVLATTQTTASVREIDSCSGAFHSQYTSNYVIFDDAISLQSTVPDLPGAATGSCTPPQLVFPRSISVGYSESRTSTVSAGPISVTETVTITILGSEDVTVPAGTFKNALKIQYTITSRWGTMSSTTSETHWFAAGVGSVRSLSDVDVKLTAHSLP